jgi:hypothetical protein
MRFREAKLLPIFCTGGQGDGNALVESSLDCNPLIDSGDVAICIRFFASALVWSVEHFRLSLLQQSLATLGVRSKFSQTPSASVFIDHFRTHRAYQQKQYQPLTPRAGFLAAAR